jgi:hypothetical protein
MSSPMNFKLREESIIAWKGWFSFKVYIPNKPDRYGIKAYLVSESKSGNIRNLEVYTDKSPSLRIWI